MIALAQRWEGMVDASTSAVADVCWLVWASGSIAPFTLPWLDYLSELGTKNEDQMCLFGWRTQVILSPA